jgi:hypothetical protein
MNKTDYAKKLNTERLRRFLRDRDPLGVCREKKDIRVIFTLPVSGIWNDFI